jgi:hypothetical protein
LSRLFRILRSSALISLVTIAGILVVPSSAQAYPDNLTIRYARVDTDNCTLLSGSLQVIEDGNYCRLNDSVDNTYFHKDAGADALKIEVRDSTGMVAKVEFHPYDEKLWVYDTKNDGDTVYVRFTYVDPAGTLHPFGPYSAAGTSNAIDILTVDFDIPEGYIWLVQVFDDSASTDPVTDVFLGVV